LAAGPDFFTALRIPLLAGRGFNRRDQTGPLVAVVNEAWAKVNLDGANPIGQHVISYGLNYKQQELEIVGLAKNARYDELGGAFPAVVYMPVRPELDLPVDEMTYFLRTARNPAGFASAVREAVREADPRIPVAGLTTQAAQIDRQMAEETLFARLCTAFALLALMIACVGLYGTTSYAVARRTGEIGIRMALGASRGTVVWMVLRDVLLLAGVGLAVSLPLAFFASRAVKSLLFGVKPGDPAALAGAAAILLVAALAAGYVPATKASRIDPMKAVRTD
jgi:predicted permease